MSSDFRKAENGNFPKIPISGLFNRELPSVFIIAAEFWCEP